MILVNHTYKMLSEGKLHREDYNYPLVQFYRFNHAVQMKGAEKKRENDGRICGGVTTCLFPKELTEAMRRVFISKSSGGARAAS